MSNTQTLIKDDLNKRVDNKQKKQIENALKLIGSISTSDLSQLPTELVRQAFQHQAVKATSNLIDNELIKQHNVNELLDQFLKQFTTNTKKSYQHNINRLIAYCELNGLNYLLLTSLQIDNFLNKTKSELKSSLSNTIINANSSFYGWLVKHNVIKTNPIIKVPRKKPTDTKNKYVPTKKDIEEVLKIADPVSSLAIKIMLDTAIRVSSLSTFKVSNGKYTCNSKTGKINGACQIKVSNLELQRLHEMPTYVLSRRIDRVFNKVTKKSGGFSHSIRHYVACQVYSKTKDILLTSKKLHHSNISTTQTYLQSLNILD